MKSGIKIGAMLLSVGAMTALGGCVYPAGYYQRTGVVYGDGGGPAYGGGNAAVDTQDDYAYPADVGYGAGYYGYDAGPWYGYGYGYGYGPVIGLGFYGGGYWGGGRGYRGPWRGGGGHYGYGGHGGWGGHGGVAHSSGGHASSGHGGGGHH
jgi:hypothetical protein